MHILTNHRQYGDNRYLKDHILYRSKSYLALRSLLGGVQIRAKERKQGDDSTGVFRVSEDEYESNLRELVDRIQRIDAIPILFGYPLEREGYTKQHREKLKNLAVDMDVLHFDPQAQMEEESRQSQMYFFAIGVMQMSLEMPK